MKDNSRIDYSYDFKGNRISDSIDSANIANYTYDYNNLLVESNSSISGQNQILQFNYGPDNQRYRKFDHVNNEITLYANKDYERIYKNSFLREQKYYITSYLTLTKVNQTGELKKNFMQKDRLGSTTQILDKNGDVLHTKSYDAFGKPRNGDWTDTASLFQAKLDFSNPDGTIDLTKRGFTDHEHLDEMQLIHMNGRMYDYNNGRFLSVDPFIQSPTSTQSMNPYTYIFNNPLSGTDPSGYKAEKIKLSNLKFKKRAVTGSHIKQNVSASGDASAGGANSSFTLDRGGLTIQGSGDSGIDSITTSGSETKAGKGGGISDTGNQAYFVSNAKNAIEDGIKEFFSDSKYIKNTFKSAYDQATDRTSQEIAKVAVELSIPLPIFKYAPSAVKSFVNWFKALKISEKGSGPIFKILKEPFVRTQVRANGSIQQLVNSRMLVVSENHFKKDIFKLFNSPNGKFNLTNINFWKHVLPHRHVYTTSTTPAKLNANWLKTFQKQRTNSTKKTIWPWE